MNKPETMARVKDVRSLFSLSLIQVCNLIIFTSRAIYKRNGGSMTDRSKKQILFVQRYILNHIHPQFLDEIVNTFDKLTSFQWLVNDRVKSSIVAMCMHPFMTFFEPKFQLPVNDEIYICSLRYMNRLRSLNLCMVCSDEILEIVGKSCPLLECIDITSKVESATNSAVRFNALKLRFFVSDQGLEYLHQCKLLKKVVMNGIIRSNCGGRKISNAGVKKLILNLNKLKFINYQDMGLVLENTSSAELKHGRLKLLHLQDNHVTLEHIDLFSILCPKLQSLSLCIPQTNALENLSEFCLDRLATNSIKLTCIDLWFFTFNISMINFLSCKGNHLTSLSLKDCQDVDTHSLIEICNYCPNLKALRLNLLKPSDYDIQVSSKCYFKHLEELYLSGSSWDPGTIFSVCIYQSMNLKILSLSNKNFPWKLDREIQTLILVNPLSDLKDISFLDGCKISFPLLKEFLLFCKNLGRITVIDDVRESLSEQLIHFISSSPFDVNMEIKFERDV